MRRHPERGVLQHVVREHLETFPAETRARGGGEGLPRFVERELRAFLGCGVMASGFARFRCSGCAREILARATAPGADRSPAPETQAPAAASASPPSPPSSPAGAVGPTGPRAPPPGPGYVRPRHVAWAEPATWRHEDESRGPPTRGAHLRRAEAAGAALYAIAMDERVAPTPDRRSGR